MSDRAAEDYVEILFDSSGDKPMAIGHASRLRGRHVAESERPLGSGSIRDLTEDDVLAFVLKELEPLVEK